VAFQEEVQGGGWKHAEEVKESSGTSRTTVGPTPHSSFPDERVNTNRFLAPILLSFLDPPFSLKESEMVLTWTAQLPPKRPHAAIVPHDPQRQTPRQFEGLVAEAQLQADPSFAPDDGRVAIVAGDTDDSFFYVIFVDASNEAMVVDVYAMALTRCVEMDFAHVLLCALPTHELAACAAVAAVRSFLPPDLDLSFFAISANQALSVAKSGFSSFPFAPFAGTVAFAQLFDGDGWMTAPAPRSEGPLGENVQRPPRLVRPPPPVWAWLDEGMVWVAFDPPLCKQLDAAVAGGRSEVQRVDDHFNVDSKVQTQPRVRRITRMTDDEFKCNPPPGFVWSLPLSAPPHFDTPCSPELPQAQTCGLLPPR
jgi:hypothetical protein